MKDFTVTITLYIPITARNEAQAQERAEMIQEWIKCDAPKTARWIGDVEAAPELLAACEAALPAIRWGMTHQPGNTSQWLAVETLLLDAIAKASPQAP